VKKRPDVDTLSSAVFTNASDWTRVHEGGHGVQFYHDDEDLMATLTRYVGSALVNGDVSVVIATKPHRLALDRRLAARGLDVAVPRSAGRYVSLDAHGTLSKFVVRGVVDETKCREVVGAVLRRAGSVPAVDGGAARLFAFGEMVALLCADGRPDEAVRLEEIWNALAREYAFTLCCAYPMKGFTPRFAAPFMRICAQHSHVFPASTRPTTSLSA